MTSTQGVINRRMLTKYAWLSIVTAVATITLKMVAWKLTGSVGLFSDAAESVVNLVAAIAALVVLIISARPADKGHQFGHTKAEYFSASLEGTMIFVAALVILVSAVMRLVNPLEPHDLGIGLLISVVASLLNGGAAWILLRGGKKHRSITLQADGKHLLTDVWTTAGVLVGVGLVMITHQWWLDPVVAILVGLNILWTGWKLLHESMNGLMDAALPEEQQAELDKVLARYRSEEIDFHGIRARRSGSTDFVEMHVLVPGEWTVQHAHTVIDGIEAEVRTALGGEAHVTTHIEPREDPLSYADMAPFEPRDNVPLS